MHPIKHIIINFVLALALKTTTWKSLSWNSVAIITIAGLLIDIDHLPKYLPDLIIKRSIKRWMHNFRNKIPSFLLFHTFEFIAIVFVLSLFFPIITYFLIGFIIHLVCDSISYIAYYKTNYFWLEYWSMIIYFIKGNKIANKCD